jgi:LacI family transcriptional regulator
VKKRVTINDIAKKLGTTPATVSRALSDRPEISEETKKRVRKEAKRLDYDVNKVASSLRSGKTHIIGVLIPTAEHPFFGSVIHGITNLANEQGYDVLIHQSNESQKFEAKGINAFISARVDGIVAALSKDTKDFSHFLKARKQKIPVVFFDRINDDLDIPSVSINDFQGAFFATDYLIKKGYRRVAHVSGPQHLHPFNERFKGYKHALKENKMSFDPALVHPGDLSIEGGRRATVQLLSLSNPADAIFATEDFTALGVIKELKEKRIRIPSQFGVFGFCNEVFGDHITPRLSTIDQQTQLMGQEAFKLIFNMIKNPKFDSHIRIVLESIPVIRDSSERSKKL